MKGIVTEIVLLKNKIRTTTQRFSI
jgi:hypothetical protein